MGNLNLCKETAVEEVPTKLKNQIVIGRGGALDLPKNCKVRACVVAYDYHNYGVDAQKFPRLSAVRDGVRFAKMAKDAGAEVREFYDRKELNQGKDKLSLVFPTKEVILDTWRQMGSEMDKHDAFVFYFAGHGLSKPREIEEGTEEMMVFMQPDGTPSYLTGEDVASVLEEAFPPNAHILLITDTFYSGTLCDLSRPTLAGRPILHLSAVKDSQHLPVPPKGRQPMKEEPSAFTQALLETVESLVEVPLAGESAGQEDICVVEVYNKTFENYTTRCESQDSSPSRHQKQDFHLERTSKFDPDCFRWPLVPLPGWLISDPLEQKKPARVFGIAACMGQT